MSAGQAGIKTPSDPAWFLSPTLENVHELEAIQGTCVVFDVLMPPYRPPERDCHYWRLREREGAGGAGLELEPAPDPPDADAVWGEAYRGFRPVPSAASAAKQK